jgi:membrane protein implicated in regulation of membrane protease activity
MTITPIEIWIAVGLIFILVEFTTLPGIGFLFLGLGSLSSAIIMYYFPEIASFQIASVGLTSLAWFLLLWWPLKIFIYGKKGKAGSDYFDLVGMRVKVASDEIMPSSMGKVYWSGTTMNARFVDIGTAVKKNEELYVIEVKGNILMCSRKKPKE